MRKIVNTLLLTIVLGLSFNALNAQNNRKMDHERLVNDLQIMEGIIDKLLTPSGNVGWSSRGSSQGFYLPDYGVIFAVPTSKPFRESLFFLPKIAPVISSARRSGDDDDESNAFSFSFSFGENEDDDIREREIKELERVSSKITDFLGIYVDAIGQLIEKDKIAVYLYNSSEQSSVHLYHVLKKDIIEFKSGKIKSKTFNKRIKYSSLMKNDDMNSQIDIMAYVLNTSLKSSSSGGYNFRMSDNSVNGLYLDGFGALFIVSRNQISFARGFYAIDAQLNYVNAELERIEELDLFSLGNKTSKSNISARKKERILSRKKAFEDEMEEYRKSIEEYKLSFSTLLGNYGHTLRLVNDTEWIGVMTNWNNSIKRSNKSGRNNALIMKVLKKDVDRFNSGRISKDDFFKKIGYTEY